MEPQHTKHIFRKRVLLLATIVLLAGHKPIIDIQTHAMNTEAPAGKAQDQSNATKELKQEDVNELINKIVKPILENKTNALDALQQQAAKILPLSSKVNFPKQDDSNVATTIKDKAQKLINNLEKQKDFADKQAIQTNTKILDLLIDTIEALVSKTTETTAKTQKIIEVMLDRINELRETTIKEYIEYTKKQYFNLENEKNPRKIATGILLKLIEQQNEWLANGPQKKAFEELKSQIEKGDTLITLLPTLTQENFNNATEQKTQTTSNTLSTAYRVYTTVYKWLYEYLNKITIKNQIGLSKTEINYSINKLNASAISPVAFAGIEGTESQLKNMQKISRSIAAIINKIIDNNLWEATEENNNKLWKLTKTALQRYTLEQKHTEFLKEYIKQAYIFITEATPSSTPHRVVNQQMINHNHKLIRSANKQWIDLVDTTLDDLIKYLPAIINNFKTVENKLLLLPHRIPTSTQSGNNNNTTTNQTGSTNSNPAQ